MDLFPKMPWRIQGGKTKLPIFPGADLADLAATLECAPVTYGDSAKQL